MNRDLVNDLNVKSIMRSAISTNTTTVSTAIDTYGYDKTMFVAQLTAFTDGAYAISLTECDTVGGSYTAVPAANLILDNMALNTALPTLGTSNLAKQGCFGTKQFIKASVVSTSITTGATVNICAIQEANIKPTV